MPLRAGSPPTARGSRGSAAPERHVQVLEERIARPFLEMLPTSGACHVCIQTCVSHVHLRSPAEALKSRVPDFPPRYASIFTQPVILLLIGWEALFSFLMCIYQHLQQVWVYEQ